MIYGVLITFRRTEELREMLRRLDAQTRPLDHLVVVDNAPQRENREAVSAHGATYLPQDENLGPAGGLAVGLNEVLNLAHDDDAVVLLDDDDPPASEKTLARLEQCYRTAISEDPRTAAVGFVGARLNRRNGQLERPKDDELHGRVPIDYIGGNGFPMMRVGAVRTVSSFDRELFFGFDDLEYGLRLQAGGFTLYGDGDIWRENRSRAGRLGDLSMVNHSLEPPSWRRYYSLRNLVTILWRYGLRRAALRMALVSGIAKPMANLHRHPHLALAVLAQNLAALSDAARGRMGRTVEPI